MLRKIVKFFNSEMEMAKLSKDILIMIDVCAKFHSYIRIEGWCASSFQNNCREDEISNIEIKTLPGTYRIAYGLPSPSIGAGLNKKFIIDIFLNQDAFPQFNISFCFKSGQVVEKSIEQLREERISRYASLGVMPKFKKMIGSESKLLDLGGRNRSRLDRSKEFTNEVVVFDVLDGENVDVVGDAHELSSYFPKCSFDAVMSICVFEHLLMPWKVVLEINKILRNGGLCCIYTHQTIGLHDSPWDFFRFSEDSWASLFNTKSGFEIIDHGSDFEQFIIPFVWHPGKSDAEKSAGREASWVIVRKISNTQLCWPVSPGEIIKTNYPEEPDGNNPDVHYV